MSASVAHIAVGLPVEGPFDYSIPEKFRPRIAIGDRVAVNFAHAKRLGFVVGLADQSDFKALKPVDAVLDEQPLLSPPLLRCASELGRYYGCSWGEAIEMMLPKTARKLKSIACAPPVEKPIPAADRRNILIHSQSIAAHWPLVAEHVQKTLKEGRGVIVLVPDSAQIPFVVQQLRSVLPPETVIHDNERTPKQELENWVLLKEGKARVVVGLRSAVFAPMPRLGLIVVYDEDNASYQEEQTPFYQIRDVALMRAFIEGCATVFACASPSVELMHFAGQKKFERHTVAPDAPLVKQIIDMTNFTSKGPIAISYPLRNNLEKVLADQGSALVFINRRGFNTFTRCLFCGHILQCERCASNLAYSSSKKKFECRRCNTSKDPVRLCPKCGKDFLKSQGRGVERVVADLRRIFPSARVEGFDRETAAFPKRYDILVATQAVFRQLGEAFFDSVAVLEIDAEFNRNDYRSSQRAFSLLSHLALLARKRVEIQTYHADNSVLRNFADGKTDEFYENELKLRRELKLPPYYHLVKVTCRGVGEKVVSAQSEVVYNLMVQQKPSGIDILGLQPDGIGKLRDKFRFSILVRGQERRATLAFVKESLAKIKRKSGVIVTVQVES